MHIGVRPRPSEAIEYVTLERIGAVTVNANRYVGSHALDSVIGLSENGPDLMTMVLSDLHWVRWSTAISPQEAQQRLHDFDPNTTARRFHLDREDADRSNIGIRRQSFGRHAVTDAVELHTEGGDGDSVIVWRRPLEDELPYNRMIAYFPNDGQPISGELHDLIDRTMVPDKKPADLQHTLDVFHTIYTKYAHLVSD